MMTRSEQIKAIAVWICDQAESPIDEVIYLIDKHIAKSDFQNLYEVYRDAIDCTPTYLKDLEEGRH
tara:strand:+ start:283 stop:480 length:198 start_codon:yes stop_codon:yes gene_type:complete